jgi:hypothetical protein
MRYRVRGGDPADRRRFDADAARRQIDAEKDVGWDRLIAAYERGLADAVAEFATRS